MQYTDSVLFMMLEQEVAELKALGMAYDGLCVSKCGAFCMKNYLSCQRVSMAGLR